MPHEHVLFVKVPLIRNSFNVAISPVSSYNHINKLIRLNKLIRFLR
ncbi:hypothetical protein SAMN04488072_104255 [Lentibacillus halodurans]|uniref:Uncharacterized protein n=1 Tax=Lentibacillus halodurans TaxID=237679 RepID=A0A1I0X9E6_9BACI|nr:hypothetical protein SAMN04488072_104255 [Lentibacillus halodurans]